MCLPNATKLCRKASVSAVFDQFKACDILGHVKEVAPYLEQKLDELVEKYDFLITRRGKGLMQGVVCKLPVGKVAAAVPVSVHWYFPLSLAGEEDMNRRHTGYITFRL